MISTANFVLAVFIKRKQLSRAQAGGFKSFDTVLSNSLRGETTFNVLKGLGMAGFLRQVPSEQVVGSGNVGVMETNNFGACIVLDRVGHDYGSSRPVDRPYLYVLVNDQTPAARAPVKMPSTPVKYVPDSPPRPIAPSKSDLISDVSIKSNRKKPEDVLRGFNAVRHPSDKGEGAHRMAAVIKMLMIESGQIQARLFQKITPTETGFDVVMKNGSKLHISEEELKRTVKSSMFSGRDKEMLKDANFVLAAFIKLIKIYGVNGHPVKDFDEGLSIVTGDWDIYSIFRLLHLSGWINHLTAQEARSRGGVGITHDFDIVIDNVKYRDGKEMPLDDRDTTCMFINFAPDTSPQQSNRKVSYLSDRPVGVPPENIWSGFYQGEQGNCVTVAEIKAAMIRFGQHPQGIYKRITETSEGYTVTMRDMRTVRLTHEELTKARAGADFRGEDEGMLNDAIFLYAVSAKVAQMTNHELSGKSFEAAMGSLNDGEMEGSGFSRLGLSALIRKSSAEELASGVPGVLLGHGHSVVVYDGFVGSYNRKDKLAASYWMRNVEALKLI